MYRRLFAGWREALPPRKREQSPSAGTARRLSTGRAPPRSGGRRHKWCLSPFSDHQHNDLGGKKHAQHLIQVADRYHGPVGGGSDIGDSYGRYFRTCRRDESPIRARMKTRSGRRSSLTSTPTIGAMPRRLPPNGASRASGSAPPASGSRAGRRLRRSWRTCSPRTRACASKSSTRRIRIVSADAATEEGTVRVIRPRSRPATRLTWLST